MANLVFTAIEDTEGASAAVADWKSKFQQGSKTLPGLQKGEEVHWHPTLGLWGHFGGWDRPDGSNRYWNGFGIQPVEFRRNIVVEINPPDHGANSIMQGVLAFDDAGSRWILHKGRLSIPDKRISESDFDSAANLVRVSVAFSSGNTVQCIPVACIDATAQTVQQQTAEFVATCLFVRDFYRYGPDAAARHASVEKAERSTAELTTSYDVAGQPPKTVAREHGHVWQALASALDALKIKHTNERVGRWGPDLRTTGATPVLFEIKVTTSAHDLQRAVGQLLLYERLLGSQHHKVLVLPNVPQGGFSEAALALGIQILTYSGSGKSAFVDADVTPVSHPGVAGVGG